MQEFERKDKIPLHTFFPGDAFGRPADFIKKKKSAKNSSQVEKARDFRSNFQNSSQHDVVAPIPMPIPILSTAEEDLVQSVLNKTQDAVG